MSIHLMCLTSNGGLPIFNRKRGDCENLPFSTVASLNGAHMFCKSQGVKLQSTKTEDWTLLWKDYENVLTLIVAGKNFREKIMEDLLDAAFGSFVLFIGFDEIISVKCMEKMKREAKSYIPIVDKLLEICETSLLNCCPSIVAPENAHILNKLNEFSSLFGSLFCSIVICDYVAVATEGWWDLDSLDRQLLMAILSTSEGPKRDIPVYLPKKSPNTAYRFVTVPITTSAILCILCGSEPQYHDIINTAHHVWKSDIQALQNAEKFVCRNFPDYWEIDSSVLSILLVKNTQRKCVMLRNPQQTSPKRPTLTCHRLETLRKFFLQSVETSGANAAKSVDGNSEWKSRVLETYWSSDHNKCHSFNDGKGNTICVLYVPSIPVNTMRLMSKTILNVILQDKSVCW